MTPFHRPAFTCRAVLFVQTARRKLPMGTSAMRCSVVIPCHNGADLTRACIASLLHQDGGAPAEILIVDNGSTDATARLASLGLPVRVLEQGRNLGFAGGVNAGIRAASQPLVLVLNNDTQAAPDL